jgi:flagellar hook-length control protein FliK
MACTDWIPRPLSPLWTADAAGTTVLSGGDQSLVQYRLLGSRADPKILPPQTIPVDPEIPRAKTASDPVSIDRPSAPKISQTVALVATVPGVTAEGQTLFQWVESMGEARPSTELTTEVRISAGSSAKSATQQFAAPAQIARQIADHIPAAMGKPVQIMLQPEELGRVRLSVSVSETGVIVSILAERGETLDLMRRNIDQLQQDFQTLGFGTADFSFQSEGALSDAESDSDQDGDTEGPVPLSDNGATILIQAEGLDMRL